ncbi:hypothetical protein RFI_06242, partial [Reticulomyxa filosa]
MPIIFVQRSAHSLKAFPSITLAHATQSLHTFHIANAIISTHCHNSSTIATNPPNIVTTSLNIATSPPNIDVNIVQMYRDDNIQWMLYYKCNYFQVTIQTSTISCGISKLTLFFYCCYNNIKLFFV